MIASSGKFVCPSFMDADGNCRILESEIKDNLLLTAIAIGKISAFFVLVI